MQQAHVSWDRVFKVWWLWMWRASAITLCATLLLSGLAELLVLFTDVPKIVYNNYVSALATPISMAAGMYSVLFIFRKRFSDFRVITLNPKREILGRRSGPAVSLAVRVWWLVQWRTLVMFSLLMTLGWCVNWLIDGSPEKGTLTNLTLLLLMFFSWVALHFYNTRSIFYKNFSGFTVSMALERRSKDDPREIALAGFQTQPLDTEKDSDVISRNEEWQYLPARWHRVFRVWWLWIWRVGVVVIAATVVVFFKAELLVGLVDMPVEAAQTLGLFAGGIAILISYWFSFRSIFEKDFNGFRVIMFGDGVTAPKAPIQPTLWRAVRVWWLVCWRSIFFFLFLTVPILFISYAADPSSLNRIHLFKTLLILDGALLIISLFATRSIFHKKFAEFRVAILTPASEELDLPDVEYNPVELSDEDRALKEIINDPERRKRKKYRFRKNNGD